MRFLTILFLCLTGCILFTSHSSLHAQVEVESDLFIADRGLVQNGSDSEIRRYTHTGTLIGTLPSTGSGPIRGMGFDLNDNLFVARGNSIIRYTGDPFVPDANPFAMGTRAQNVEVHPTTGNIWASFGVNSMEAELREYDANGVLLQSIIDPLFVQLRSFCFSEDGERIFIANVEGNNVLVGDLLVTPPVLTEHTDLGSFGAAGYAPIHIARDPAFESDDLYVSGDFIVANDLLRITGDPGLGVAQSAFNLTTTPGFNAAGGLWVDSWGSLYAASRDRNSGIPGLFSIRLDGQPQTVPPLLGSEHLNPIDVAFLKRRIDITLTSNIDNDVFQVGGNSGIVIGDNQPTVKIEIDTPDFPNSPYVILYSLMTNGQCANGNPERPSGEGLPFNVSDPRRTPLELDALFLQSQQLLGLSINGVTFVPFALLPELNCPQSTPGCFLFQFGLTDASGHAEAFVQFPTFPAACFPNPFDIRFGFVAGVLDMTTGPLGLGLVSGAPTCLSLFLL